MKSAGFFGGEKALSYKHNGLPIIFLVVDWKLAVVFFYSNSESLFFKDMSISTCILSKWHGVSHLSQSVRQVRQYPPINSDIIYTNRYGNTIMRWRTKKPKTYAFAG